jgi:hypothetical protein
MMATPIRGCVASSAIGGGQGLVLNRSLALLSESVLVGRRVGVVTPA